MTAITKLSDMQLGASYTIEADGTLLRARVVEAGARPVVIVSGECDNERFSLSERSAPVVMQFIGWTGCEDTYPHGASLSMFCEDEQPAHATFLVAITHARDVFDTINLCCAPAITVESGESPLAT